MKKGSCFICLTYYQYMLANMFAEQIYLSTGKKSLIILKYFKIEQFVGKEYTEYLVLERNILGKIFLGMLLKTPLFNITKIHSFINKKDNKIVYFNDRDPLTQKCIRFADKYNCKRILIEEGVGTYFSLDNVELIGTKFIPDEAYVGYPELFQQKHLSEIEIKELNYKILFSEDSLKRFIYNIEDTTSGDILILGQCTSDDESYREYENELIKRLNLRYPYKKIVVKPHPRDDKANNYVIEEKLNTISLLDKNAKYPIEMLIHLMKINCVISLFSSGGVTLANMFNDIKVIYVFKLFQLNNEQFFYELEQFGSYMDNLFIPNDFEELEKNIDLI